MDTVCFLVKAPDSRLTPTQTYIFDEILSLFGVDIEDNFCMLATFADGKPPPVLSALKEAKLPYEQYFPFNFSELFAGNSGESVPRDWTMSYKSFQRLFHTLALLETKNVRITRDVLLQQQTIKLTKDNVLLKLNAGLDKAEELRTEVRLLESYKKKKAFAYTVAGTKQEHTPVPKIQNEIAEKYRRAKNEKMTVEVVLDRMNEEIKNMEDEIINQMKTISECNNVLNFISLRPDPLSVIEYVDLLIESEKMEKRAGFQGRISSLQQCRKAAAIGDHVNNFKRTLISATTKSKAK